MRLGKRVAVGRTGVVGTLSRRALAEINPGFMPLWLHPVRLAAKETYTIEIQARAGTVAAFEPKVLALTRGKYDEKRLYSGYGTWDLSYEEPLERTRDEHESLQYVVQTKAQAGEYLVSVTCDPCGAVGAGPESYGRYRLRVMKGKRTRRWPAVAVTEDQANKRIRRARLTVGRAGAPGRLSAIDVRQDGGTLSAFGAHFARLQPKTSYTVEVRRVSGAAAFTPALRIVSGHAPDPLVADRDAVVAQAGLVGHFRRYNFTVGTRPDVTFVVSCDPCGKNSQLYGTYRITVVPGTHTLLGPGLSPKPLGTEPPRKAPEKISGLSGRIVRIAATPQIRQGFVNHLNDVCGDTWCEGDFDLDFKALSCTKASCKLLFTAKRSARQRSIRVMLALPAASVECSGVSDSSFCSDVAVSSRFSKAAYKAISAWLKANR